MDMTYLSADEIDWVNHHHTIATISPDYLEITARGLQVGGLSATWDHLAEPGSAREILRSHCIPCSPDIYAAWLKGYRRSGGRISHERDYNLVPGEFWLLQRVPKKFPKLFGARSYDIVVPKHLNVDLHELGDLGHSTVYTMRGYGTTRSYAISYKNAR